MKKLSLSRLALFTAAVAALLIPALLAYLGFTRSTAISQSRTPAQIDVIEDYSREEIQDPEFPIGTATRYSWTVSPSPAHGTCLGIYTYHQYIRVYVDGTELYRLDAASDRQIVHTPGANWSFFPIYREDAGKELSLLIIPAYESARDREPEVYMGIVQDIFLSAALSELPQIVLCVLTCLVGVIFLTVGLYSYFTTGKGKTLIAHGLFSIMLSLWKLLDLRTTNMLLPQHTVFLYYCSVCMLALCAVPLMKALSRQVSRVCRQIVNACCIFCASVCILQLLLQILGLRDLRQMLFATHICIVGSSLIVIPSLIYDSIAYPKPIKSQDNKVLLFVCIPGALLDIALFYFTGDSAQLSFTLASHLIYTVIVGTRTMIRANRQEAEIEKSHTAVLRSQIQPHFLFNSLTAIAQLCDKDPALAKQATITFSEYYRGNLRAIDRAEPIPFAQELEHLNMYLFIEKLRFGSSLNVVFDVQTTDFRIPALTIQPLVENAVKHGVGAKEEGGTVTLTVRELADSFTITVADDGAGFDPTTIDNRERQHIGLENVRKRLLLMCDATLHIKSSPGTGTAVTIALPKEGLQS